MKMSLRRKDISLRTCVLLMFLIIGLPVRAESNFGVILGKNLEDLCLSDQEYEKGMCVGYVEAMLEIQGGKISHAEIQCLASYLLPVRNAALHGWSEIQELLSWVDERLAEGDTPTEAEEFAITQSRKLASDVQDRKELLHGIRNGNPPMFIRPCLIQHGRK